MCVIIEDQRVIPTSVALSPSSVAAGGSVVAAKTKLVGIASRIKKSEENREWSATNVPIDAKCCIVSIFLLYVKAGNILDPMTILCGLTTFSC
jgi:hypothetical protein